MDKVVVVSLFDGISGGRLALQKSNINVLRYYSSEIDKYAVVIADYNWKEDSPFRLGDVRNINGYKLKKEIKKDFGEGVKILLIGGSPCQNFSFIGKRNGMTTKDNIEITDLTLYLKLKKEGFEFDGFSYLFWEYVRIKEELQPDFFFLENVKMPKKWSRIIDNILGVKYHEIDSALVSGQRRKRFYWFNWESDGIRDKGILLKECLNLSYEWREIPKFAFDYFGNKQRIDTMNWINNKKANTITTNRTHTTQYLLNEDKTKCRFLECDEAELLQTLPINYTKYGRFEKKIKEISKTQRYKAIDNGWTIDIIAEIFKALKRNNNG